MHLAPFLIKPYELQTSYQTFHAFSPISIKLFELQTSYQNWHAFNPISN